MPRPISWLPRLHEIRRSVSGSARSHYSRPELETLFQLQPRAAQKILEMLPTVAVGTSRLVERGTLADFLERVNDAGDVSVVLEQVRQEKTVASRRRLRSLVRKDTAPVSLTSLPEALTLNRGSLTVEFQSVEELATTMYFIARVLEAEGEEFAKRYEPTITDGQPQYTAHSDQPWSGARA